MILKNTDLENLDVINSRKNNAFTCYTKIRTYYADCLHLSEDILSYDGAKMADVQYLHTFHFDKNIKKLKLHKYTVVKVIKLLLFTIIILQTSETNCSTGKNILIICTIFKCTEVLSNRLNKFRYRLISNQRLIYELNAISSSSSNSLPAF